MAGEGLAGAAGFMKGLNSVLLPYAQRKAEMRDEEELARKKERLRLVSEKYQALINTEQFDSSNPLHVAGQQFAVGGVEPKPGVLEQFISTPVIKGVGALISPGQQQPTVQAQADVVGSVMEAQAPTQAPSPLVAPTDAAIQALAAGQPPASTPGELTVPPIRSEQQAPERQLGQAEAIGAAGGSISIQAGPGVSVSYPGDSFDVREKKAIERAVRALGRGVAPEKALDGLGPDGTQAAMQGHAANRFVQLRNMNIPESIAAKLVLREAGAPNFVPKEILDLASGPEMALAIKRAQEQAVTEALPEQREIIESTETRFLKEKEEEKRKGRISSAITPEEIVAKQAQSITEGLGLAPEQEAVIQQRTLAAQTTALAAAREQGQRQASAADPRNAEERTAAVLKQSGLKPGTPEFQTLARKTLVEESEALTLPLREKALTLGGQVLQLTDIDKMLEKGIGDNVLGPLKGRKARLRIFAGGVGLTNDEISLHASIESFRNAAINELAGANVPPSEFERVKRQLPDTSLSARVNRVRVRETIKNNARLLRLYHVDILTSRTTNKILSVTPVP